MGLSDALRRNAASSESRLVAVSKEPPIPPPEAPEAEIEEIRYRELLVQVLQTELRNFGSGALVWALADFRENVREDIRDELAAVCSQGAVATGNRKMPWGMSQFSFPSDIDADTGLHWVSRPGTEQKRLLLPRREHGSSRCASRHGVQGAPRVDLDAPFRISKQENWGKIALNGDPIEGCDKDEIRLAPVPLTGGTESSPRNAPNADAKPSPGMQRDDLGEERKAGDEDEITVESFSIPGTPVIGSPASSPSGKKNSGASRYFAEALTNSNRNRDLMWMRRCDKGFEERKQLQQRNLREFLGTDRFHLLDPLVELLQGRSALADFIRSPAFDHISGVIIAANAVTIGIETDWMARTGSDEVPQWLDMTDKIIACIFALELIMRLCAHGCRFFYQPGAWHWNIFDFVMVLLQVFEELVRDLIAFGDGATLRQFKIMRVMRILRLIRIIRVVRIMRMFSELRTIVASVLGSLKALFWTVVLLVLFMYMMAVYFTQTVTDFRMNQSDDVHEAQLEQGFGSLFVTWLSLYQAISGGVDWADVSAPLFMHMSPIVGAIFVLYIAFSVLCIMNVVTGVFVESALKNAQSEEDAVMERNLTNIFETTDLNKNGTLEWEEFDAAVTTQEMQEFLRSIELDPKEAITLFRLVDVEERGQVLLHDFVSQCCRLRGQARSIDLMTVLYEMRHFARTFLQHSADTERQLGLCEDLLKKVLDMNPSR